MTIRATVIGHMPGGEQWQNVTHWTGEAANTDTDVETVFDALLTFYGSFNDRLCDSWGVDTLRASGVTGGVTREDSVTGLTGEVGTAPLPNDVCMLVVWTSANPGRTGRGRTFLGGWPLTACVENGANGAGVVDGGPAGAVAAAASALTVSSDPRIGVYSRPDLDASPPRPIGHFDAYTGGYVSRRWSTQRRRDLETPRFVVPFT